MTMNSADGCLASSVGAGLDPAVALFHSLSDATRLAIVQRLACGEARVSDLVAALGMAQSTVSAHVACLRDCALVVGRPQGRQVFYSLARPELMDLLASAETLLAATGNAVALCPNYGTDAPAGTGQDSGIQDSKEIAR
ncbi:ArsR/SmtB family transcription factor [Amycolatopsis keratiniphila]|uniref:ArsR/SmtB family transcription factor n=1 Tax=Amycolatopsis keratiniphila TaxID=129921 RepID=UPI000879AF7E|nr:metalloregulator ArsR/SmtB family transcription factor [Amycolatopsis keratiniphila]OLZ51568.1 transcriptional regulator [Amycolatopsis keratiniphila subsp. nogabecina]SDU11510.1 transcriptional regulator, ArsR family [Amycolatopsis keratiniphila]